MRVEARYPVTVGFVCTVQGAIVETSLMLSTRQYTGAFRNGGLQSRQRGGSHLDRVLVESSLGLVHTTASVSRGRPSVEHYFAGSKVEVRCKRGLAAPANIKVADS